VRDSEAARALARKRWGDRPKPEVDARTRRMAALADLAEARARAMRGELVERAKVERAVFDFARSVRDAWTMWPARVAAMLAARLGADPHAVEAALAAEVRKHLEELSRDPVPAFGTGAAEPAREA
jgi:hypothetical protein